MTMYIHNCAVCKESFENGHPIQETCGRRCARINGRRARMGI